MEGQVHTSKVLYRHCSKCRVQGTRHETLPSYIILTSGQPVVFPYSKIDKTSIIFKGFDPGVAIAIWIREKHLCLAIQLWNEDTNLYTLLTWRKVSNPLC